MPTEPEKKIQFADETIIAAQHAAGSAGKTNFEKQKEIFEKINSGGGDSSAMSMGGQNTTPEPPPQTSGVVIKNLRTFQGDVAEAIKNQHASVVTIALAEQQKKSKVVETQVGESLGTPKDEVERILGKKYVKPLAPETPKTQSVTQTIPQKPQVVPSPERMSVIRNTSEPKRTIDPEVLKNGLTIVASIVLILLGIGAVVGFYILQKKAPTVEPPTQVDQTVISFNTKETIDTVSLGREDLVSNLTKIRNESTGSDNDITYVALTKKVRNDTVSINTNELFAILNTGIPGGALRALGNQFMFGIYHLSGTGNPFLIIKLTSFDNAFAGMLAWEKTLNTDLGTIFSARSVPITSYAPTLTSSTTPITITKIVSMDASATSFRDITIQNKDARILKNARGEDILLYSFLDENTLLITSNQAVFHEILNKYVTGKIAR